MTVTSVRLNLDLHRMGAVNCGTVLIAFGSIVLDHALTIENVRILKTNEDRFIVAMPSRKRNDGSYRDIAYPISEALRNHINDQVLLALDQQAKARGKTKETLS